MSKTAIIIGAGPAGLTAALELQRHSDVQPIVLEASDAIGGISRTILYKGNRMDLGGHRFFSKSERVMKWWLDLMPVAAADDQNDAGLIHYHNKQRSIPVGDPTERKPDPEQDDLVLLVRPRRSRIYFLRKFFDYPIKLTPATLRGLGLMRTANVGLSYLRARCIPRRPEASLEDFIVNRFGNELYRMFFESYTEKVWGVHPRHISAEWGAQRIKGLSLTGAVQHFVKQTFAGVKKNAGDPDPGNVRQKDVETSLVERFLYPKFGPGQLWEHVASLIESNGGAIHRQMCVTGLCVERNRISEVVAADATGNTRTFSADYVISTMPVQHLIRSLQCPVPKAVREASEGLIYRDFLIVGLLVDRLLVTEPDGRPLKDTWIYIQEPDVLAGRMQIFNNWSPWMVADPTKIWIGLEYFLNDTDPLWKMPEQQILEFAVAELEKIGILRKEDVLDGHVVRVPKAYPAYFGAYDRFDTIRNFTDSFENLFLVGRNGMHKYNNQDHSMLTAMAAVENIVNNVRDKSSLWAVNTEQEYHEEKS